VKDIGIVMTEDDEDWGTEDVVWFTGPSAAIGALEYIRAEAE
jgi:hypothetical protein